jgi:hypothetical protein
MLQRTLILVSLILLTLIFAAACAGPAPTPLAPDTPLPHDPQATYTAAVQTVVAELTRAAASRATEPAGAAVLFAPTETLTPYPAPSLTPEPPLPPTPTPLPAAPTPSPTIAATLPPPSDPRSELGTPTLRETFDSPAGWFFTSDGHTQMDVRDGELVMTAFNPDHWNGWAFSSQSGTDFYLEMTAAHGLCGGLDRFGLLFRAPGNSGYLLGLSCDGRYSLWTWDGFMENRILDWTSSDFIRTGEGSPNRLGVRAQGDRLAVYVNGYLLQDVQHPGFSAGRMGVFVGSAETVNYTARVDEVVYWPLP